MKTLALVLVTAAAMAQSMPDLINKLGDEDPEVRESAYHDIVNSWEKWTDDDIAALKAASAKAAGGALAGNAITAISLSKSLPDYFRSNGGMTPEEIRKNWAEIIAAGQVAFGEHRITSAQVERLVALMDDLTPDLSRNDVTTIYRNPARGFDKIYLKHFRTFAEGNLYNDCIAADFACLTDPATPKELVKLMKNAIFGKSASLALISMQTREAADAIRLVLAEGETIPMCSLIQELCDYTCVSSRAAEFAGRAEALVPVLLSIAKGSDDGLRWWAIHNLINLRAVDCRKELDPLINDYAEIIDFFGELRIPSGREKILTLAQTGDPTVIRDTAIRALEKLSPIDHARIVQELFASARIDSVEIVRDFYMKSGTKPPVEPLKRFAASTGEENRMAAVELISQYYPTEMQDVLAAFLSNPDPDLSRHAAEGLARADCSEANAAKLLELLHDKSVEKRLLAAWAIGKQFAAKYTKEVLRLLDDENENVRKAGIGLCRYLDKGSCADALAEMIPKEPAPAALRRAVVTLEDFGELEKPALFKQVLSRGEELLKEQEDGSDAITFARIVRLLLTHADTESLPSVCNLLTANAIGVAFRPNDYMTTSPTFRVTCSITEAMIRAAVESKGSGDSEFFRELLSDPLSFEHGPRLIEKLSSEPTVWRLRGLDSMLSKPMIPALQKLVDADSTDKALWAFIALWKVSPEEFEKSIPKMSERLKRDTDAEEALLKELWLIFNVAPDVLRKKLAGFGLEARFDRQQSRKNEAVDPASPREQNAAIYEIVSQKKSDEYKYLEQFCRSPYSSVQTSALAAIKETRPEVGAAFLKGFLASDFSDVRAAATGAACTLYPAEIAALIESPDKFVSAAAIGFAGEKNVGAIITKLDNGCAVVRCAALQAFSRLNPAACRMRLPEFLHDDSQDMRALVVKITAEMGAAEHSDEIARALKDGRITPDTPDNLKKLLTGKHADSIAKLWAATTDCDHSECLLQLLLSTNRERFVRIAREAFETRNEEVLRKLLDVTAESPVKELSDLFGKVVREFEAGDLTNRAMASAARAGSIGVFDPEKWSPEFGYEDVVSYGGPEWQTDVLAKIRPWADSKSRIPRLNSILMKPRMFVSGTAPALSEFLFAGDLLTKDYVLDALAWLHDPSVSEKLSKFEKSISNKYLSLKASILLSSIGKKTKEENLELLRQVDGGAIAVKFVNAMNASNSPAAIEKLRNFKIDQDAVMSFHAVVNFYEKAGFGFDSSAVSALPDQMLFGTNLLDVIKQISDGGKGFYCVVVDGDTIRLCGIHDALAFWKERLQTIK